MPSEPGTGVKLLPSALIFRIPGVPLAGAVVGRVRLLRERAPEVGALDVEGDPAPAVLARADPAVDATLSVLRHRQAVVVGIVRVDLPAEDVRIELLLRLRVARVDLEVCDRMRH